MPRETAFSRTRPEARPALDAVVPADIARADGTTHIAAIDRDGTLICVTPSGGVFRKSAFVPEVTHRLCAGGVPIMTVGWLVTSSYPRGVPCGIGAMVTRRDPETGVFSAGADPPRPTYALAW